MRVTQNPETGYWTELGDGYRLNTHAPDECSGALCDIHNRPGPYWPLNWRGDRGMMEVLDPIDGIGHPTRAQRDYWYATLSERDAEAQMVHGCNGACRGIYD